jgi:hypothetical protein
MELWFKLSLTVLIFCPIVLGISIIIDNFKNYRYSDFMAGCAVLVGVASLASLASWAIVSLLIRLWS